MRQIMNLKNITHKSTTQNYLLNTKKKKKNTKLKKKIK